MHQEHNSHALQSLLTSQEPGNLLLKLHAEGTLNHTLPEVAALFGVPQKAEHHPEVDTGVHIALCLDAAVSLNASPAARFAVLTHDLGKAITPQDVLPAHIQHERNGIPLVAALCDRLNISPYWRTLALLVCEFHLHAHRVFEMRPDKIATLLLSSGMEVDSLLMEDFAIACEADQKGRLGRSLEPYPQGQFLRLAQQALQAVPPLPLQPPPTEKEIQARKVARQKAVISAADNYPEYKHGSKV